MSERVLSPTTASAEQLSAALAAVLERFDPPGEFPAAVLAEARAAAEHPEPVDRDLTEVPFVTVDPEESTDLDQAFHLSRAGAGYRLRYAIAAVDAFVRPGGELDAEARRRGQTLYGPSARIPLHPFVLSEGAASLLPDRVRPAYVWELDLDDAGELVRTRVARALVRSRAKLSYAGAQRSLDAGSAAEPLLLLRELGGLRAQRELDRGGASLRLPEIEVARNEATGELGLRQRTPLPVEDWNAQLSLLAGIAGAGLMLDAGIGILRTMPPPDPESVRLLRARVAALGVPWPTDQPYGAYLRGLDTDTPVGLAAMHAAGTLFRGAGYTAFDGEAPAQPEQAAVAAPYAHVTAPLRRLVDRFGLACCAAISAGAEVPDWVRASLPQLPALMAASAQRSGGLNRATIDAYEAAE
ncbi:ribonuclease catalytic domain-containing protein, partial [Leucobacter sp. M11]|uniref:ribonuclease catalytic domain-containing protein n=1 Tax=Leucobacter sp. M11 TaxID=2993565 RepID=UPI002D7E2303